MAGFTSTALAVASIVGTAAAVGGQVYSGQQQSAQGRQMAAAENLNANIARQNAAAIEQSGAYEIERQRAENRRFVGRQRALIAASGVKFSGSPLDVMSDTIANQEMDLAATRYNTNIAKSRALSQATYSDMLAGNYKTMGGVARNESLFKAGTTLLTEGANTAYTYRNAFKTGAK